jgi:hypothetical protein
MRQKFSDSNFLNRGAVAQHCGKTEEKPVQSFGGRQRHRSLQGARTRLPEVNLKLAPRSGVRIRHTQVV